MHGSTESGMWGGKTVYFARPKYEHVKGSGLNAKGGRTRSKSFDTTEKMRADPEKTLLSFVPPTSGMFLWVSRDFC